MSQVPIQPILLPIYPAQILSNVYLPNCPTSIYCSYQPTSIISPNNQLIMLNNNQIKQNTIESSIDSNDQLKLKSGRPHPKEKFSAEEDSKLHELVKKYGENNWYYIAQEMDGRNIRQCRERWRNYLSPEVKNGPWTKEEDDLLFYSYKRYGPKWKFIASFFPDRTDINIKSRWQVHTRLFMRQKKSILKNQKRIINNYICKDTRLMAQQVKKCNNTRVVMPCVNRSQNKTDFKDAKNINQNKVNLSRKQSLTSLINISSQNTKPIKNDEISGNENENFFDDLFDLPMNQSDEYEVFENDYGF